MPSCCGNFYGALHGCRPHVNNTFHVTLERRGRKPSAASEEALRRANP